MHELGVVFHVIDEIQDLAKQNNVKHVNSVTLQIGTVTGIIPSYLEDCWKWAVSKQENMTECKLNIEKIEAITHCEDCNKDYNTIVYGKKCPYCQSDNTYLLQGNEFMIKEMEVI
ncbi:MAG: hydrogenase maturation nickel metallochaperone HypA [Erysipelotrichaceae bacterium]|nr:hydrogenase maturation nickel metallochaperone HypA [Erysipelotrichaceae bacterium]MBQ1811467.1 hydrogenase maturation nickel metallochaperone HypA [Erysipelotrichaceae bacterium]